MTDFELAKKKDYYSLWCRYEALMMIYWKKLPENVRNYLFEDFTDFKDSCYQVVINAVDALTLSKVKNSKTWTLWQQLSYYLQNYTTRQCVRDTYKLWNSERQQTVSEERNKYATSEDHHEYNMLMKAFTDDELQVVTQRLSGVTWATIYKNMGSRLKVERLRGDIERKIKNYI